VDIAPRFIEHIDKTCKKAVIKNVVGIVCTADSVRLPSTGGHMKGWQDLATPLPTSGTERRV
jgi:hypothetical protein